MDEKGTAFSIRPSIGTRVKNVLPEYIEIQNFFLSKVNCNTVYDHVKNIFLKRNLQEERKSNYYLDVPPTSMN